MVHCVVLGGGVSGLSLSHYLRQRFGKGIELTVIEQSKRFGGWINSFHKEDSVLELGPKSLRAFGNGKVVLSLANELGISNSVIFGDSAAKARFLYLNGKVEKVPSLSPTFLSAVLPALKEPFVKRTPSEDESIASFVSRRFGHAALSSLVEPLVLGIYGGNCSKLSIRSCFPAFHQAEVNGQSVITSMFSSAQQPKEQYPAEVMELIKQAQKSGVFSFRGGVNTLIDALAGSLSTDNLLMVNKQPTSLNFSSAGAQVELSTGETISCDHVFSTIPSYALAGLLADNHLTSKLNAIPFISIGVASMLFKDPKVDSQIKNGFGYLVPPKERQPILGVAFDSKIFPQHKQNPTDTILSVMMGGDTSIDNSSAINVETATPEQLKEVALETLRRHLGITAQPEECLVKVCRNAIPQYHVGHHKLVEQIHTMVADVSNKRLTASGNCFGRVGVPDCIVQSKELAFSWDPSK